MFTITTHLSWTLLMVALQPLAPLSATIDGVVDVTIREASVVADDTNARTVPPFTVDAAEDDVLPDALGCGECQPENATVCFASFGVTECHRWTPGDDQSPHDRGEDWHYIMSNEKEGAPGECEHPECEPSLAWSEILLALEREDASGLRVAVAKTAGAAARFDEALGSIIITGACSPDRPVKVIAQIPVPASTRGLWSTNL